MRVRPVEMEYSADRAGELATESDQITAGRSHHQTEMAMTEPGRTSRLFPSLLDRLTDDEQLEQPRTPFAARARSQALLDSIVRDVADLLNTRPRAIGWRSQLRELHSSLLTCGLPDYTGRDFVSAADRESLRQSIESVIRRLEPRLQAVHVRLIDNVESLDNRIRFEISGRVGAEAEPLCFRMDRFHEAGNFSLTDEAT